VGIEEAERALFRGGPGTLTGPYPASGSWVLLGCLDREPARRLTQEELRAEFHRNLKLQGTPAAVARWVQRRREQVGVSVDEEVLDELAPGI
jgi:parvulin-like peptidyl-prolyl isomerase